MNKLHLIIFCAILFAWPFKKVWSDEDSIRELAEGNQAFACDLYKSLSGDDGNIFFSPHSISTALAMTYAGAREITETQMSDTLHFPFGQDVLHPLFGELESSLMASQIPGELEIHTANSLWPDARFEFSSRFMETVRHHYHSDVFPVDYRESEQARIRINTWVEEKTREKIKDLIPTGALDAMTRLVLVNAVYFKGNWLHKFEKSKTTDQPFHKADGEQVTVKLMSGKIPAKLAVLQDLQVLELPYQGEELTMMIALPASPDGLAAVESTLSPQTLATWAEAMRSQEVRVFLPAFSMTQQFQLKRTLNAMGMVDAFDPVRADFSGMGDTLQGLYISDVIHKAFVEVNEEGTEAAAATAVIMRTTSMPPPPPEFRADHPFLFLIKDNKTGSILFAGRYADPVAD